MPRRFYLQQNSDPHADPRCVLILEVLPPEPLPRRIARWLGRVWEPALALALTLALACVVGWALGKFLWFMWGSFLGLFDVSSMCSASGSPGGSPAQPSLSAAGGLHGLLEAARAARQAALEAAEAQRQAELAQAQQYQQMRHAYVQSLFASLVAPLRSGLSAGERLIAVVGLLADNPLLFLLLLGVLGWAAARMHGSLRRQPAVPRSTQRGPGSRARAAAAQVSPQGSVGCWLFLLGAGARSCLLASIYGTSSYSFRPHPFG